jgi:hypothetical protein
MALHGEDLKTGWSEKVRDIAVRDYVQPARQSRSRVKIKFGDLKEKMLKLGFPPQNANQIASPLESRKFWEPLGLEMCTPRGQSRKVSTVFEFRFLDETETPEDRSQESSQQRAFRLTEKLRGLMKDEIAAHGGTEGFMRWVRSDEDEEDEDAA